MSSCTVKQIFQEDFIIANNGKLCSLLVIRFDSKNYIGFEILITNLYSYIRYFSDRDIFLDRLSVFRQSAIYTKLI